MRKVLFVLGTMFLSFSCLAQGQAVPIADHKPAMLSLQNTDLILREDADSTFIKVVSSIESIQALPNSLYKIVVGYAESKTKIAFVVDSEWNGTVSCAYYDSSKNYQLVGYQTGTVLKDDVSRRIIFNLEASKYGTEKEYELRILNR